MTLLALPLSCEVAVLELGTNSPGEIQILCEVARPNIGVLTLIDLEHTEGLINLDGVEAEEGALMDFLARSGGIGMGNADDPRVVRQLGKLRPEKRRSFGYSPSADTCVERRTRDQDFSSQLTFRGPSFEISFGAPWVSRHRALGLAAALSVATELFPGEVGARLLQNALGEPLEAGRGSLVRHPSGALLIDESYNSNPGSCRACIDSAVEIAEALRRSLTLVLGEMRELGLESEAEHQALGRYAARVAPDRVLFVGGDARYAAAAAREAGLAAEFFATSELARSALLNSVGPENVVLIKGSRGVRLEALLIPPENVCLARDSANGASEDGFPRVSE
jgi:UDP-N-acetylmuramoyl-tripeptide--D-alanyl-D-alanine ligase